MPISFYADFWANYLNDKYEIYNPYFIIILMCHIIETITTENPVSLGIHSDDVFLK